MRSEVWHFVSFLSFHTKNGNKMSRYVKKKYIWLSQMTLAYKFWQFCGKAIKFLVLDKRNTCCCWMYELKMKNFQLTLTLTPPKSRSCIFHILNKNKNKNSNENNNNCTKFYLIVYQLWSGFKTQTGDGNSNLYLHYMNKSRNITTSTTATRTAMKTTTTATPNLIWSFISFEPDSRLRQGMETQTSIYTTWINQET